MESNLMPHIDVIKIQSLNIIYLVTDIISLNYLEQEEKVVQIRNKD